jgi:peptide-methionine (S)-S-oxide reductase
MSIDTEKKALPRRRSRQLRWFVTAACVVGGGLLATLYAGRSKMATAPDHDRPTERDETKPAAGALAKATFGSGCFWCTEAVFLELKGVRDVQSGYSGGHVERPTYEQVCSGETGHAEVVQITYEPAVISYAELLEVFWRTHDPTTLNRQGNDIGTQYRSVIFHHDDEQRRIAEQIKRELNASGAFDRPIVTEISPCLGFYPAEPYHQKYYELNPRQPYCMVVIAPKMEKFRKVFANKLKAAPTHGE